MIPYFELRTIPLGGGIEIAAFGTLVALGVVAGALFAEARARRAGISERQLYGALAWVLIPGFLCAHLVAVFSQGGLAVAANPSLLLQFWNGMSSFGGFAGALAGFVAYHAHRPPPAAVRLTIAEILVQALVIGWVFGRLGCTLIHDHIGKPSEFWLAIRFPDGPRHDLGFYELAFTIFVLLPAVFVANRKPRAPGTSIVWIALLYAPARFFGDFLRNTDLPGADVRYGGLTVAQYGCIGLALIGLALARHAGRESPTARS
jgi:phosphatidylglycerol:prolipoprotein diacylglycerol transferase